MTELTKLLLFAVAVLMGAAPRPVRAEVEVGKPARDFALPDLTGKPVEKRVTQAYGCSMKFGAPEN